MKVFISYSHNTEDTRHSQNVRALYKMLCEVYGVDAEYDEIIRQSETAKNYDELSINLGTKYDKVVVVLSEEYKRKADSIEGGVGEEFKIIYNDIKDNPRKYILVAFEPVDKSILPVGLHNRDCLNLTDSHDRRLLANKLKDINVIPIAQVSDEASIEPVSVELPSSFIEVKSSKKDSGTTQTELRIKAKEILSDDLNKKDGNFYKKYIHEVYKGRKKSQEIFNHFLQQNDQICFVVVGKAGKGKTSLFCNLAKGLTEIYKENYVPLIINGSDLRLDRETLRQYIENKIGSLSIEDINQSNFKKDERLVIFIDAINEVEGDQSSFEAFNSQLNELVILTKQQNLKICYAVSCRTDFWPFFKNAYWATEELFAEGDDQDAYSYEVGDFDGGKVIEDVIETYFRWFRLKGEIKDNALQHCRDPLMLRYLCEAFTERPPNDKTTPPEQIPEVDIGTHVNLRRKEVFDTFVENIRDRMFERVKSTLGSEFKEENKEEYTTMYLLNIARLMFENNKAVISLDEVISVAEELKHPDAEQPRHAFKTSDTIFFTFIDEGLILDRGAHDHVEKERETYSFIFETYFEYTLGRYIALQRWYGFLKEEGEQRVNDDLDELIKRHAILVKGGDFTNLIGAIQYAIQVIEEDKRYEKKPDLWLRLIDHLLNAPNAKLMQYQMAFSALRDSSLFSTLPDGSNTEEKSYLVDKALDILWSFVEKVDDFVIGDDVKSTLVTLGDLYLDKVVGEMYDWLHNSQDRVTKKFATDVISGLASKTDNKGILILEELADFKDFKESFWLGRTLVFTANQLGKKSLGEKIRYENSIRAIWSLLLKIVKDTQQNPFTRDYAFSFLVYYTRNRTSKIREIIELFEGDKTTLWGKWNLVYELKNLLPKLKPVDYDWVLDILLIAKSINNKHLDYAIYVTLKAFPEDKLPEKGFELLYQLKRSAWLPNGEGVIEKIQNNLFSTAIVYSPGYLEPAYENHIECRQRLQVLLDKLYIIPADKFKWLNPCVADELDIKLVHKAGNDRHRDGRKWPTYLKEVKQGSEIYKNNKRRARQTGLSELRYESYDIAKLSAGGVIRAVNFVFGENGESAWSLGRPPGHLANNSICVLNNIAIGTMYAKKQYKSLCEKIIIIDCDAHHGTHTSWAFRKDPSVIYFSIHIDDGYSREEGRITNIGEGGGEGYNFNIVYPKHTDDRGYKEIVDSVLLPIMLKFQPSLIMLSAGFDGHFDDELNPGNSFTEKAYIYLAQGIRRYMDKRQAKLVAAFEGGYSLEGLSNSMVHMMNVIGNWNVDPEVIGFVDQSASFKNDQALNKLKKNIQILEEELKVLRKSNPSYNLRCYE